MLKSFIYMVCFGGLLLLLNLHERGISVNSWLFQITGYGTAGLFLAAYFGLFDTVPTSTKHGSAGWAKAEDIKELLINSRKELEPGSLLLGKFKRHENPIINWVLNCICGTLLVRLTPEFAKRNVGVLGPSGSGKSYGMFLPNCEIFPSFIATDPKGQLYNATSGKISRAMLFAPRGKNSYPFNPVPLMKEDDTFVGNCAVVLNGGEAKSSGDGNYFTTARINLLKCLLSHTAYLETPNLPTLFDLLTSVRAEKLAQILMKSPSQIARKNAMAFAQTTEEVKGSVVSGLIDVLGFLNDPSVRRWLASTNDPPNFELLRIENCGVYYVLNENDVDPLKNLTTLFFTVALQQLKKSEGHNMVAMLFDEFGNVGQLPAMKTNMTLLRSKGIFFVLGLQDIAQADSDYGREDAKIILNGCNTTVAYHGIKGESAENLCKLLGKTTVTELEESETSKGGMFGGSTITKRWTKTQRDLATPDEIRQLRKDEVIIIVDNLKPLKCNRLTYTEIENKAKCPKIGKARVLDFKILNDVEDVVKEVKLDKGRR